MTQVAEITMTEQDARRLTERIRIAAVNYSEAKEKLLRLVAEAKGESAHVSLGYKSWTAYLSDVLSDEPLRLAREERREVVQLLTEEGMSTRAIASVVGTAQSTVALDRSSTERNRSVDEPLTVESLDGSVRTYQPKPVSVAEPVENYDPETGEILDADPEPELSAEDKKINRDVDLVNDIRLFIRTLPGRKEVKALPQAGRDYIIAAMEEAIADLKGE